MPLETCVHPGPCVIRTTAAGTDYCVSKTADEKPACSCPTDAEIRAAIHHSHQQLTNGGSK